MISGQRSKLPGLLLIKLRLLRAKKDSGLAMTAPEFWLFLQFLFIFEVQRKSESTRNYDLISFNETFRKSC